MGSSPPASASAPPASGPLPTQLTDAAASGASAHMGQTGFTPAMPATGTPAPNAPVVSDKDLVMAACQKVCGSIFRVEFTPKNRPNLSSYITRLITNDLKLADEKKAKWEAKMKEVAEGPSRSTTGFVVGEKGHIIFILTCTYPMQACFAGGHPMTVADVDEHFSILVKCDHVELQPNPVPAEAEIHWVDTHKSMLLLRVRKSHLCQQNHLVLEVANKLPDGHLAATGMVSWPRDRHRTMVPGTVCHAGRSVAHFDYENEYGYDFKAVEINITSEAGSSGAPAIDKSEQVLGMLHDFGKLYRGNSDCISYFVPYYDITTMLNSLGINKQPGTVAGTSGKAGTVAGTSGGGTSGGGVKRKLSSP